MIEVEDCPLTTRLDILHRQHHNCESRLLHPRSFFQGVRRLFCLLGSKSVSFIILPGLKTYDGGQPHVREPSNSLAFPIQEPERNTSS